jgi:hypothetical protein
MVAGPDSTTPKPASRTGRAILFSNAVAIVVAMTQDWDLRPLVEHRDLFRVPLRFLPRRVPDLRGGVRLR